MMRATVRSSERERDLKCDKKKTRQGDKKIQEEGKEERDKKKGEKRERRKRGRRGREEKGKKRERNREEDVVGLKKTKSNCLVFFCEFKFWCNKVSGVESNACSRGIYMSLKVH